jgi:hypothetical protein
MRGPPVCRLHGGKGGGPRGGRNGAYRTGRYTAEASIGLILLVVAAISGGIQMALAQSGLPLPLVVVPVGLLIVGGKLLLFGR